MKTLVIMWYSRHSPTSKQQDRLKALFKADALTIIHVKCKFESAKEIASKFRNSGAQDLVLVAPLSVIRALVEHGVRPLWAQMATVRRGDPRTEVIINKRPYRHVAFHRITGFRLDLEPPTVSSPIAVSTSDSPTLKTI